MNKAKICIVTTRNIFDAPCLDKYKKIIKSSFDIIYWDRCNIKETCGATEHYKFEGQMPPNAGTFKKLLNYIKFSIFANKILINNNYEKLIVFPTQCSWLILKTLKKRYDKKYILDIRDYAGENQKAFKHLTYSAVRHSCLTSITSPAYQKFLPQKEYLISHNIQAIDQEIVQQYRRKAINTSIIQLSFIGSVRFIEQLKKLISLFNNDKRFHLNFIGSGSEQLNKFCIENKIENVTLIGRFAREDLPKYYLQTDIAINVYGNNDPYLDYALSNKLYSAAIMGMPILVSPGTFMSQIVNQYGFGYAIDINNANSVNEFYDWYMNLDIALMRKGCDDFMTTVKLDERKFVIGVDRFLRNFN